MNPVWASTLGVTLAAAAAGLLIWPFAGPVWGWAAVAAVLAARVLYHAAHLQALLGWLRAPDLRQLPQGRGVWEEALAGLHRYIKGRDGEHDRLMQALARFRAAGRALPDGVVILDAEGRIEWANPTATRHFGIDPRRDLGQPVIHFVRQPDFVAYLEAGAFDEPIKVRSTRSNAALALRIIAFGAEQKLLNSRDVSGEERIDRMRRDFVANVSHELKTPLTVLAGFVETLGDDSGKLSETQRRRFLGLMTEQARRMRQLIEDLLMLSSLESSAAPEGEAPVPMPALLERLAEEARALSAGRHRILIEEVSPEWLQGSERELHGAFSNLVANAVHYTPAGGTVRLAWRIEGGRGVFSVTDSGIGIEPRHIPRLTERFYRVDTSRSRESGGTGLGLAIVKHVLTRHEASLDIESGVGQGSVFSASFPPRRLNAPAAARAAA